MPTSVVAHRYWDRPGGGQLVCAAAAASLDAIGYQPILASPAEFDPSSYSDWYGIDISRYPVETMGIRLRAFGIYMRLLVWRPAARAIREHGASLLFIDEPTYGPLAKAKGKGRRGYSIVEYIHFPLEALTSAESTEDPYVRERYGRFPMNLYWWAYSKLLPHYMRGNPFEAADAVLANSRWTARVAKEVYGEEPRVLNPPVPPGAFPPRGSSPPPFDSRAPTVVMVGRFSEEKRYTWVVSEVLPLLLREVPGAKLAIFGATRTATSRAYMERVREIARRAGVEGALELRPDEPRSAINGAMDSARAFLHATVNEHWGIAVAEAMARGLPPVLHASGGAWTDLAMEGEVGIGYGDAQGAAQALAKLLTDEGEWGRRSRASLMRAGEATLEGFKEGLGSIVRSIAARG